MLTIRYARRVKSPMETWWQDHRRSVVGLSLASLVLVALEFADPLHHPRSGVFYRVQAVEGASFVERMGRQQCAAIADDPEVICALLDTSAGSRNADEVLDPDAVGVPRLAIP